MHCHVTRYVLADSLGSGSSDTAGGGGQYAAYTKGYQDAQVWLTSHRHAPTFTVT